MGEKLIYSKLYVPANLSNSALGDTYNITVLQIGIVGSAFGVADIPIAYNAAAEILDANITITVV